MENNRLIPFYWETKRLDGNKHYPASVLINNTKYMVHTIEEYLNYLKDLPESEIKNSLIQYLEDDLSYSNSSTKNILRLNLTKERALKFLEWEENYEKES